MRQTDQCSAENEVLIERFQHGEEEAFDRLMALHTDRVFALAWGVLQNREDAKDAVQEVFIKLHAALPKFPPENNLSAWLYRVCLNHCIDRKRRAKRRPTDMTEDDWDRLKGPERDEPEFRARQSEIGRTIRGEVDALPERQRMVFVLRHYKLLSINETAEAMGCTSGAVKAHLSRATARLRDRLRGTFVFEAGEVDRSEV